jgi:hypothetical protein
MEEINRFVVLAQSGRFSVTDLCEQFGISRKTGYKHLERYAVLGLAGLQPRSHRPHHSPQRTDETLTPFGLAPRSGDTHGLNATVEFAPRVRGTGSGRGHGGRLHENFGRNL